ncbi:MAG: phenylalanine--tRNA ligase subunit alpha [Clostridia bacterium]|nr:phenylalanine--tRNA ligase subunit alpha [Clostridia bacterium]
MEAIRGADDLERLGAVRVRLLGKKGLVTGLLRRLGSLPPEERPAAGQRLNALRDRVEAALAARQEELAARALAERLAREVLDVTLPGRRPALGRRHPLRRVQDEVVAIFCQLGFEVFEGPEAEWDALNFDALNMPPGHPARDMQDSFYLTDSIVLRTHTSPAQIRFMRARAPQLPIRMVAPGRVYRRDDDATHSPVFHQLEGLLVDRDVTLAELKGTLETFARRLYGPEARVRLRPSYFPFTEPSAEVDVSCSLCGGRGCRTCKGSGWLEILGAGMVHPQVLRNGGYDPEEVTGFAFGMGLERIAMLKYGVDDLRLFYQNDLRFLRQF